MVGANLSARWSYTAPPGNEYSCCVLSVIGIAPLGNECNFYVQSCSDIAPKGS